MFRIFCFLRPSVVLLLHGLSCVVWPERITTADTASGESELLGGCGVRERQDRRRTRGARQPVRQTQEGWHRQLWVFPALAFQFQTVDLSISLGKPVMFKPLKGNLDAKFTSRVWVSFGCFWKGALARAATSILLFSPAAYPTEAPQPGPRW